MASQSKLEQLPVEIHDIILSYLVYPRSRLPGLTERQSEHDYPEASRRAAKQAYSDGAARPDTDRYAADLLQISRQKHPFNELASTSRRLRAVTERFCNRLARESRLFNLPLLQAEEYGPAAVYPDLSGIVYRRLWLQHATRYCIYCNVWQSSYPHRVLKRVISACNSCFYAQVFVSRTTYAPCYEAYSRRLTLQTINEVEEQFHLSSFDLAEYRVRRHGSFLLKIDVEALVLHFYGTKLFHDPRGERRLCRICLQSGTLSRIMAQRTQREPATVPGTDGWIGTRVPTGSSAQPGSESVWFRLLSHRNLNDLYFYRDDGLDAGYQLRFVPIGTLGSP